MRIHETRYNRLAAHVEHFRARRNIALCAHPLDAIVFYDDISVLQNFIAPHRDHGRAAQHDRALWRFSRKFQIDCDLLDFFLLLLQFLFFFFLVLFFVLLGVSRLRSGVLIVRVLLVRVLGVRIFLVALFLFVLRRFERDRTERLPEKARAHRPGDGFSAIGPCEIVRANVCQTLCRDGGGGHAHGWRLSAYDRHGNDIELIHHMRENPLAVGARHDVTRGNRLLSEEQPLSFHHEVCPAIRAVVAQRDQPLRRVNVDAVLFVREMRAARSARRQNQVCVSPVRGNPDEVGVFSLAAVAGTVLPVISVAPQQDNFRAVRRPCRITVHRQGLGQLHRCSARGRDFPKLPAIARPGHINEGPPIGRPSRLKFMCVFTRQPPRFAAGQIHRVEMRHGGESQLLPIGRFHRVHDQPHFHHPLFNRLREIQLGPQFLRYLGRERNYFFRPGGEIEPLDLAILVVDDFLAARQKGVARKNIAGEERFLIVARDRILHPAVFAAFQVAQTQAGLCLVPSDVENLFAVRRKHGAKRAFYLVDEVVFVAGLAIAPRDVPRRKLLVVIERA